MKPSQLTTLLALLLAVAPIHAQETKTETKKSEASQKKAEGQTPDKMKGDKKAAPIKTRMLKVAGRTPQVEPLNLKIPVTWKEVRSTSRMRAATLEIPVAKGDKEKGELAVFVFGAQGISDNIDRWVGQFKSTGRKAKVTVGQFADPNQKSPSKAKQQPAVPYFFVEVSGTYKKSVGPPIMRKTEDKTGYRMLAVLIPVKGSAYVLKLTGPDKTVAAQAASFRKSFGGDAKKEKPWGRKKNK